MADNDKEKEQEQVQEKPVQEKPVKEKKPKGEAKEAAGKKKKAPEKKEVSKERPFKTPQSRLLKRFREEITPALMKQYGWDNLNQVPKLEKVVVNMGVGEASRDIKVLEAAMRDLVIITGQKPMMMRARKSVASYKIRTGMPIGTSVTIRGNRMYEFIDKLFSLALPRVRDFQGLNPNSFDGTGNFTFGIKEQLVFPEIDYDDVDRVRGMDITIVTTTNNDMHAYALLRELGCPFRGETRDQQDAG
jgi:large subunit ribosomal protein L5